MNPATRRALGAYYTPRDASEWMAAWLVEGGEAVHTVLEPSSGDGAFVNAILAAADAQMLNVDVHAVEIDAAALQSLGDHPRVKKTNLDFHRLPPFPVDAAIGNPPFVRFRHLDGEDAQLAARAAGAQALGGAQVDASGSIWLTIVLHAATFLRPGGRMAFVLPSDALYVKYAQPFWRFMSQRFGHLRIVRCRQRIYPDILQDVVLLLADRSGASTDSIESELYATRQDLTNSHNPEHMRVSVADMLNGDKPFAKALLGETFGGALETFQRSTVRADTYAKFNIGYVDANKKFFHPTPDAERLFRLPARSMRAAAKSGRTMSGSGWATSSLPNSAVHKLWLPDPAHLTNGEREYLAAGEAMQVPLGYKARRRKPWYLVPDVRVPDLLMPVFGELPKLMYNDAKLVASNSLLLGFWRQAVNREAFMLSWYSSITRLGIELSVHSLGGGVLVLVPAEADAVRMPPLPAEKAPAALIEQLDAALRAKDLPSAYRVGDAFLQQSGWEPSVLEEARSMADLLLSWRVDRRGTA